MLMLFREEIWNHRPLEGKSRELRLKEICHVLRRGEMGESDKDFLAQGKYGPLEIKIKGPKRYTDKQRKV